MTSNYFRQYIAGYVAIFLMYTIRRSITKVSALEVQLIHPCPDETGLTFFENTVDLDQLASEEAI